MLINRDFRNGNLEQVLLSGEKKLQERYQLRPVRSSLFARVYKFSVSFGGSESGVYFKQYLYRSAWDFIKHLVYPGRAKRAFKASLVLEKSGLETPVVVAMGECKFSFLERENFLLTVEAEDAEQIHQFLPGSMENLTTEQLQDKRELIRAFGRTVGRMHAKGISHGDLRLGNVLARRKISGWCFFFIDNERTKKFRRLPARLRLKNLVQANMLRTDTLTGTDRMRFFTAYLRENPSIAPAKREWAQKIVTKTDHRLEKKYKCSV